MIGGVFKEFAKELEPALAAHDAALIAKTRADEQEQCARCMDVFVKLDRAAVRAATVEQAIKAYGGAICTCDEEPHRNDCHLRIATKLRAAPIERLEERK